MCDSSHDLIVHIVLPLTLIFLKNIFNLFVSGSEILNDQDNLKFLNLKYFLKINSKFEISVRTLKYVMNRALIFS